MQEPKKCYYSDNEHLFTMIIFEIGKELNASKISWMNANDKGQSKRIRKVINKYIMKNIFLSFSD
jgi:hypothetical protein